MKRIILFDGVCNVCDRSVQFIIKHDPKQKFQFASLQSDIGQQLLKVYKIPSNLNSMVLIEEEQVFTQSTAALKIAKQLHGLYSILTILLLIPRPIRNGVYRLIANNRYSWFGKKDQCMLPSPQDRQRFLD